MTQPRVFEFAKELGLQPLELMNKLREWKIPVKSHMAELDSSTIDMIRSKIHESSGATRKKVVAKKKPTPPLEGENRKVVATPTKATTAAAKSALQKTPAKPSLKAPVSAEKASSSPDGKRVIRRKTSTLEVKETRTKDSEEVSFIDDEKPEVTAAPEVASVKKSVEPIESKMTSLSEPSETLLETSESKIPETTAPQVVKAPEISKVEEPPASSAMTTPPRSARPGLKKEVVMSGPGAIPPRSRGNIVGRMDLSRATGPRHQTGPASGGDRRPYQGGGGYRPGGPSGGTSAGFQRGPGRPSAGIRTGFFAVQAPEFPDLDPNRREDRARKKIGPRPSGPGTAGPNDEGTVREEVVETFTASEYRKREVVFQPKKKTNLLNREALKTQITKPKASKRVVEIYQTIKVVDFAKQMSLKSGQVVSHLMKNGMMVTANDAIDFDTAALVAPEFGFEAKNLHKSADEIVKGMSEVGLSLVPRAPIVTVMGHVDHGKTTLLDAIRKADVASGEAGGITQHIGAYRVTLDDGKNVTFIDTPGHQAFTAMRARGANVTDIAVIVVAADDGVMPQTQEAISHAKNAGVPIIVAVNKMDRPNVNPDRIKQQLTEFELVPEEWGGTTSYVPVSALKREGIKELIEQIHLIAEIQELKADPTTTPTGIVIEARMDRGKGVVATILVQQGTLEVGQPIVAGATFGRIRAMTDDRGNPIVKAGPSTPVEILGLSDVPLAGDKFAAAVDETTAREIAHQRREEATKVVKTPNSKMSLEDLFAKVQAGDTKELTIVLKSDVAGSAEAIRHELEKIESKEVKIKIVHAAVGGITESDVLLASTSKAIVIGFNTRPDSGAAGLANREGIEIKNYSVIYELVDDVKKAMSGLLAPTIVEKTLGRAEVRNVFTVPKFGTIAGCFVVDGKMVRSALARLVRDGRVIYDGKISSLKRFKDDAREVVSGFECGLGIENYNDLKVGDVIEAFEKQSIVREI